METIIVKEGTFKGMNELEYVIWQDDDENWYGCATSYINGNIFESDDVGPFSTREEVIEDLDEVCNLPLS